MVAENVVVFILTGKNLQIFANTGQVGNINKINNDITLIDNKTDKIQSFNTRYLTG